MWLAWQRRLTVHELSREDGHVVPTFEAARQRYGIADVNRLSPSEAVALARSIKAKALKASLPDSTDGIRSDRDRR